MEPHLGGWGSGTGAESGSLGPKRPRPTGRERCSAEAVLVVAAVAGGTVDEEGTPGAWDEVGADKTEEGVGTMVEGGGGGVEGGGGGVGQAIPIGVWLCWTVTGGGAGNMGRLLWDEVDFWMSGGGAVMGISGRGPAAFPGGLLIMTGGEGGRGVMLQADDTTDLGGGSGDWIGTGTGGWGCCCRLGTVA